MIFSLAEKAKMYATVAQSVEQLIRNQQVAGSSPASSSILKRAACQFRLAALFTGFRRKALKARKILKARTGEFPVRALKFYGSLKRDAFFIKRDFPYIFAFTLRVAVNYGDNRLI